MKRTVSLLLSIITVISLFVGTVTFGSVGASAAYMLGDVDGDGKIGNNDYLALKAGIQTNAEYSGTQRIFADLNGDGVVTSVDVMMIVGYINGTVTSLAKGIEPGYEADYDYVTIVNGSNLTYNAGNDSTGGNATVTDSGVAREEQAKYLDKYIDELPSYVSIVTGDFNEQPSGTVFSKMTNTYGYSSLAKIAATTDGQSHKTYEDGQIYDYIFIKDKARIKALVYDVRTAIEANSDHYPLYGKFQLIN